MYPGNRTPCDRPAGPDEDGIPERRRIARARAGMVEDLEQYGETIRHFLILCRVYTLKILFGTTRTCTEGKEGGRTAKIQQPTKLNKEPK